MVFTLVIATWYKVYAYEYESDIDPQNLLKETYWAVENERIGALITMVSLIGNTYPRYVIVLVKSVPYRRVKLIAYCYFNRESEFVNYVIVPQKNNPKEGIYVKVPAGEAEAMLRKMLIRLHSMEAKRSESAKKS